MERGIFEIVDTESLVPEGHLLRKIDEAVDFNKIYDIVEPLYCADNGRPSVDPVVLFKMVLIQHLYGLGSLRRTAEEVSLNVYCDPQASWQKPHVEKNHVLLRRILPKGTSFKDLTKAQVALAPSIVIAPPIIDPAKPIHASALPIASTIPLSLNPREIDNIPYVKIGDAMTKNVVTLNTFSESNCSIKSFIKIFAPKTISARSPI